MGQMSDMVSTGSTSIPVRNVYVLWHCLFGNVFLLCISAYSLSFFPADKSYSSAEA